MFSVFLYVVAQKNILSFRRVSFSLEDLSFSISKLCLNETKLWSGVDVLLVPFLDMFLDLPCFSLKLVFGMKS